ISGNPSSLVDSPLSRLSNRITKKPRWRSPSTKPFGQVVSCAPRPMTRSSAGSEGSPSVTYSISTPLTLASGTDDSLRRDFWLNSYQAAGLSASFLQPAPPYRPQDDERPENAGRARGRSELIPRRPRTRQRAGRPPHRTSSGPQSAK